MMSFLWVSLGERDGNESTICTRITISKGDGVYLRDDWHFPYLSVNSFGYGVFLVHL
jgi:hypothetical protein